MLSEEYLRPWLRYEIMSHPSNLTLFFANLLQSLMDQDPCAVSMPVPTVPVVAAAQSRQRSLA